MKKILNLIFLFMAVAYFTGCKPDYESVFDESSSKRLDETLSNDKAILAGADCGWIMEYYPSETQAYGGYNIWVKFSTDGTVEAMSEIYGTATVASSQYSLAQSGGPVLSFDTYNKVIHYFSDPINPDGIGDEGDGTEGDFEFTIMSASADSVILRGKKTANTIKMYPLDCSATTKEKYLTSVTTIKKEIGTAFQYIVGTNTATATVSFNTLSFTYSNNEGETYTFDAGFIVTPNGIKFYSPVTIFGVSVSEMNFVPVGEGYFEDVDGSGAVLVSIILPLNQQLVNGAWYFSYDNSGEYAQYYWATPKTKLTNIGEELYYGFIGTDSYFGLNFGSTDGAYIYKGVLKMGHTFVGEDQITLNWGNSEGSYYDSNGSWYYQNASFHYLVYPFGYNGTYRTFTLTTDNIKNPTWIKLEDNARSNNYFTLYKSTIYYPLSN